MTFSTLIAFTALLGAPVQEPIQFDGLGGIHRTVTTSNPKAQQWFDQGLAFLFAFNHDEALRAFRHAAKLDPGCAMAWWGIATASGPHINNPAVAPESAKEAWAALTQARAALANATQAEKDLVGAASVRFSSDPAAPRGPLDKAYADAMRQVWRWHLRDPDVGALFAESLMDLRPWDLWKPGGAPQPGTYEILKALERTMALDPRHPLALHLYIHTVEASPNPERGLEAADTLWRRAPGLGHLVHMPSHIYVRTGRWIDAIQSNLDAVAADTAYVEKVPGQGFYVVYIAHNHQMLAFAAMMRGEGKVAVKAMDNALFAVPREVQLAFAPAIDGYFAAIYEVRVRFGWWDEILDMPLPGKEFPVMRTMRQMARAVAFAVKGDPQAARKEQYAYYAMKKEVPEGYAIGNNTASDVLRVAEHLMNGEILLGEGKTAESIAHLRQAVAFEDGLKYNEPPDWLQPTRHALGAVMVREGMFAEAEKVYREDLKRLPNNGWATYGLAQALAGQGKTEAAKIAMTRFAWIWADSDTKIGSSCLCVPGAGR